MIRRSVGPLKQNQIIEQFLLILCPAFEFAFEFVAFFESRTVELTSWRIDENSFLC